MLDLGKIRLISFLVRMLWDNSAGFALLLEKRCALVHRIVLFVKIFFNQKLTMQ